MLDKVRVDMEQAIEAELGVACQERDEARSLLEDAEGKLAQAREALSGEIAQRRIIAAELTDFKQRVLCCICFEAPRAVVVQPCFHLVSCSSCQRSLQSCPVCRTAVQGYLRVHVS